MLNPADFAPTHVLTDDQHEVLRLNAADRPVFVRQPYVVPERHLDARKLLLWFAVSFAIVLPLLIGVLVVTP